MELVNKFSKLFLAIAIWGVLFLPIFACQAASGLASVWAEERQPPVTIYMPIHTEGLADFGIFFVYFLIMLAGFFALSIIMITFVKMYLASGNEDVHHRAQHSFVAGVISFVLAMVIYFSLDHVVVIVQDLAAKVV